MRSTSRMIGVTLLLMFTVAGLAALLWAAYEFSKDDPYDGSFLLSVGGGLIGLGLLSNVLPGS